MLLSFQLGSLSLSASVSSTVTVIRIRVVTGQCRAVPFPCPCPPVTLGDEIGTATMQEDFAVPSVPTSFSSDEDEDEEDEEEDLLKLVEAVCPV